jgi:hypothetical protein
MPAAIGWLVVSWVLDWDQHHTMYYCQYCVDDPMLAGGLPDAGFRYIVSLATVFRINDYLASKLIVHRHNQGVTSYQR